MSKQDPNDHSLLEKLNADLDTFIEDRLAYADKNPHYRDEEKEFLKLDPETLAEQLKNHPAFMTEFDPSKPMSSEMEALQALKYESDCSDDNATSFKEDGNKNFKLSSYRWAIDNYTAGIKCLPVSKELNAILYTNRAAAQFRIGNCRSGLHDSIFARKFKADHTKAIMRGIHCLMGMRRYADAILWCDSSLLLDPEGKETLELRKKAEKGLKEEKRDRRREELRLNKLREKKRVLVKTIENRGIRLENKLEVNEDDDDDTEILPEMEKVRVDEEGVMHWPVMFLYPEHAQSDQIEAFNENATFKDHICHMFDQTDQPIPWDLEGKYKAENLKLYFEDRDKGVLYKVPTNKTLLKTLQHERYMVYQGTPSFILLPNNADFTSVFLKKYQVLSF